MKHNVVNFKALNSVSHRMASEENTYKQWFDHTLRLPQYYKVLKEGGYDDFSYLYQLDGDNGDQDLKSIGITKKPHRRRILHHVLQSMADKLQDEVDIKDRMYWFTNYEQWYIIIYVHSHPL